MSTTDELLKNNEAYAAGFDKADLPAPAAPRRWPSSPAWTPA